MTWIARALFALSALSGAAVGVLLVDAIAGGRADNVAWIVVSMFLAAIFLVAGCFASFVDTLMKYDA